MDSRKIIRQFKQNQNNNDQDFSKPSTSRGTGGDSVVNKYKSLNFNSQQANVLGPASQEFEKLHPGVFLKNIENPRHGSYPEISNKHKFASLATSVAGGSFRITSDVLKNSQETRKKHPRITIDIDVKSKPTYNCTVINEKQIKKNSIAEMNKQDSWESFGDSIITLTSDSLTVEKDKPQQNRPKYPRILSPNDTITEYLNRKKQKAFLNRSFPSACSYAGLSGTRKRTYPNFTVWDTPLKVAKKGSLTTHSTYEVMPHYKNYQLIGDSQLLRFSEQLLDFKHFVSYAVTGENNKKTRRLGYCISGQTIQDLQHRLTQSDYKLSKNVVMLIGTNDIVNNTPIALMFEGYKSVLSMLKTKADRIVLLTVPPVPKLVSRSSIVYNLEVLNEFVKNCADDCQVSVLDLASQYMGSHKVIALEHFEEVYDNSEGKVDLIHLNLKGFQLLKAMLDKHLDENE